MGLTSELVALLHGRQTGDCPQLGEAVDGHADLARDEALALPDFNKGGLVLSRIEVETGRTHRRPTRQWLLHPRRRSGRSPGSVDECGG